MRIRVAALLLAAACSSDAPAPAALDTRHEACARCRRRVSEARFAAQLVAPGEEPRFFDDVGCLRDFLRDRPRRTAREVAYVADHRTRSWVRAANAVYVRVEAIATPMGSHLVAFADATSLAADRDAAGGVALAPADDFAAAGAPDGAP